MPLFLVTCVYDEGVYENDFRVLEAPSRLAVAEYILRNPYRWYDWLNRTYLWDGREELCWSAEELLKRIDNSYVDGDSRAKLSLYEIKEIEQCIKSGAAQNYS